MDKKETLKIQIAETVRNYNAKGWSPATSTNYSFKYEEDLENIFVSRSGVDKSSFQSSDFIQIDSKGLPTVLNPSSKPSAETIIHCVIYSLFPETRVILHSHSIYPVMLTKKIGDRVVFEGYEIQKGFEGQTTRNSQVAIPIFENSQEMNFFEKELALRMDELKNHAFMIKQHGTYAWGRNLFEAKRHLETLEYLCQCKWMEICTL